MSNANIPLSRRDVLKIGVAAATGLETSLEVATHPATNSAQNILREFIDDGVAPQCYLINRYSKRHKWGEDGPPRQEPWGKIVSCNVAGIKLPSSEATMRDKEGRRKSPSEPQSATYIKLAKPYIEIDRLIPIRNGGVYRLHLRDAEQNAFMPEAYDCYLYNSDGCQPFTVKFKAGTENTKGRFNCVTPCQKKVTMDLSELHLGNMLEIKEISGLSEVMYGISSLHRDNVRSPQNITLQMEDYQISKLGAMKFARWMDLNILSALTPPRSERPADTLNNAGTVTVDIKNIGDPLIIPATNNLPFVNATQIVLDWMEKHKADLGFGQYELDVVNERISAYKRSR